MNNMLLLIIKNHLLGGSYVIKQQTNKVQCVEYVTFEGVGFQRAREGLYHL